MNRAEKRKKRFTWQLYGTICLDANDTLKTQTNLSPHRSTVDDAVKESFK